MRHLILGTGRMASTHAEAFSEIEGVSIVACVDLDNSRASSFAKEHGIPQTFTSLDEAAIHSRFDTVSNCTPDAAHFTTTMEILKAGAHVFCEKPLATNFADAQRMAREAVRRGVIHGVNLTYRNVSALQTTKELIAEGRIGAIRHFEASYLQSWLTQPAWGDWRTDPTWLWRLSEQHGSLGVLGDVGVHIFDFVTFASGQGVKSLTGQLSTFDKAEGRRIGDYTLDANDSFSATVTLDQGAMGVVHASRFASGNLNNLKLQIYGDKGGLRLSNTGELGTLEICEGANLETAQWEAVPLTPVLTNFERFVNAVRNGAQMAPDFHEGARLQAVLDSVFLASEQERQISLL
ncbi:MAG: Gfo/Idh/MocA family oxidoreductase [Boseongicola sp.]|nr:Gfo/Idh/MocA family oxidoreductase [Boseongicola sp.]